MIKLSVDIVIIEMKDDQSGLLLLLHHNEIITL